MINYKTKNKTQNIQNKIVTKAEYKYKNKTDKEYKFTSRYISMIDIPYKRYKLI